MIKMIYILFVFLFIQSQSAYSQEASSDSCFGTEDEKPWAILLRYSNQPSTKNFKAS